MNDREMLIEDLAVAVEAAQTLVNRIGDVQKRTASLSKTAMWTALSEPYGHAYNAHRQLKTLLECME